MTAFSVFGVDVKWYGILVSLAIFSAIMFANYRANKTKVFEQDVVLSMALPVILSAVVGARLYYVVFSINDHDWDFIKIINIRSGGMAIHGGLLFGLFSALICAKYYKIKEKWLMADCVAPALSLGQAIGRWGNFANGEAHGGPTDLPWAITVQVDGRLEKVHPTFLYESLWSVFIIFLIVGVIEKRHLFKFKGASMLVYVILYSIGRFFIEGLRTDALPFFGFRIAQVISVVFIIIAIIIWYFRQKHLDKTKL